MAKQPELREDLIAEATALIDRVEFRLLQEDQIVVVGFRKQTSAVSVFFDQEPAYHFNSANELRRAFVEGRIVKVNDGRLISLTRRRDENGQSLVPHQLSDVEQLEFLAALQRKLTGVQTALSVDDVDILRTVSGTGQPVVDRVATWLQQLPEPIRVANSSNVC